MAEKKGFEVDQLGVMEGTSFSQLLYEVEHDVVGLCFDENQNQIFDTNNNSNSCSSLYSSSSDVKTPKMLCFGDFQNNNNNSHGEFVVSCSDSSLVSSITKTANNMASLSSPSKSNNNKKRNVLAQEPVQCGKTATVGGGQRSSKKSKTDTPPPGKRREKLGERISTLQQLVSPFGKTDTASVLHEAMGYIRFLHDQAQVLCSPYLQQRSPSPSSPPDEEGEGGGVKKLVARSNDLRSRGLCLVPAEYTEHVANNNGSDFWSPAAMGNNINNSVPPSAGYRLRKQ